MSDTEGVAAAEGSTNGLPGGVAARAAAWRALRRVHADAAWSVTAVDRELRQTDLDARDRAFAANLAYETMRWEGTLDWLLDRVLERPVTQTDPAVLDVLRLSAWQLLLGAAPDHAVVSTAVDLVRAEIGHWATAFVNGSLRSLARLIAAGVPWPPEDTDEGLGVRLGYAAWIVTEARRRFGDRARAVLEAGNEAPGVTLRAAADAAGLLAELRASGVDAEPGRHAPEAVRAPGVDPGRLPAVAQGRASVQDEASMLVVRAVAAGLTRAPEPLVLDACAGPGGKSGHLAQLGARVVAGDVHLARARLVATAADRLGMRDRVRVVAADAARPPWRDAAFDAVLVDAPCTGLGIVRRRPDVRWRRVAADPARLAALQLDILERCVDLVRPSGVLTYSACTWTRAETADLVRAFLAVNGDRVALVEPVLGGAGSRLPDDPGVQLAPDSDGVDGMYVASFQRR